MKQHETTQEACEDLVKKIKVLGEEIDKEIGFTKLCRYLVEKLSKLLNRSTR